jgi:hypothetical protein
MSNQDILAAIGAAADSGVAKLSADLRAARQTNIDTAIAVLKGVVEREIIPPAPAIPPNTATTGILPTAGALAKAPPSFVPQSGKTYANMVFNDQVGFDNVSDVTFINCLFDITAKDTKGAVKKYGARCDGPGHNRVFKHCEFRGMGSCAIVGSEYQAIDCSVHHSQGDGFKAERNVLIQGCYVTMLGMSDGAHADGVQIRGGSDIRITGNFFDMPTGVAGTHSNACLFLQLDARNVTFHANWCRGGNYTICAYPEAKAQANVAITANVLWGGKYGPANLFDGVIFRDNVDDKGVLLKA